MKKLIILLAFFFASKKEGLAQCQPDLTLGIVPQNCFSNQWGFQIAYHNVGPHTKGTLKAYSSSGVLCLTECVDFPYGNGIVMTSCYFCPYGRFEIAVDCGYCNPVSVTIPSFIAKRRGINAYLEWTTVQEKNVKGFVVERRTTGIWDSIYFHPSYAVGGSYLYYSKLDYNPNQSSTKYRLRIMGTSGDTAYSEVREVPGVEGENFIIFPNPAYEKLNVAFLGPGTHEITVFDAKGRVLVTKKTSQPLEEIINYISKGVHIVRVVTELGGKKTTTSKKFIFITQ